MKPWDSVRREVAGAWRSVRYDLDHRSKADAESKAKIAGPPAEFGPRTGVGPAVGHDGANTPIDYVGPRAPAGGGTGGWRSRPHPERESSSRPHPERESIWAPLRDPRRLMAMLTVSSVVAASAIGTFFAVTGGLGVLLVNSPGAPAAPQTKPASAPHSVTSTTPRHRPVPASPRPSASASVRVSPSPAARSAAAVKPGPSVTATAVPPSDSPTPTPTPSTTVSHRPSPSATASAETTP